MPNDDGGVSAALAGARATLTSAQNFSKQASGHSVDPNFAPPAHKTGVQFAQQHGADHQGGTLGAELNVKQTNVDAYVASQK